MAQINYIDEPRDRIKREFSKELLTVRPKDISQLSGNWGPNEIVKETALLLIDFFKVKRCWCSFTISELIKFSKRRKRNPNLIFYGILGTFLDDQNPPLIGSLFTQPEPWLVAFSDGRYMITEAFVRRCSGKRKLK